MAKFSKYHGLKASQAQLDFVDVNSSQDTPVFIDPFAIEIRSDPWSNDCAEAIRVFFHSVLAALRNGDDGRAKYLLGQLHEPAETYLGLSQGKPKGRGVGSFQADLLADAIRNSVAFESGKLEDLSELALYVEGIGRDKVSDLTTNIIRAQLVEYTKNQCGVFGISRSDYVGPPLWDAKTEEWRSATIKLPYIGKKPVLLVPKTIVRRNLSLNSSDFYSKHILTFLQAEHVAAHGSLTALIRGKSSAAEVKNRVVKKPTKAKLKEIHPKNPSIILEMINEHPELLEYYKKLAAERNEPLTISEKDDSVAKVCALLSEKLKRIKSGPKAANEYHSLAAGVITTVFYPHLALPSIEWEINDGRKRVDVVYMNDSREGFLQQRRDAGNTAATMVIVECKNYSKDIANPEIDQLLGRFDNRRGKLGWVFCRKVDDEKRLLDRCRDLAKAGSGFIMVFTDSDIHELLHLKAVSDEGAINRLLLGKYKDLIS
ncbi:hypothetical protein Sulfitobl28_13910 [Sulfitobacter pontiacus]|uniref:hypothetical protein n=1 Tax=Sulfitobacter pontiacus TaxID=60137 RepID=UPI00274197C7|nr:hypothetical protein Sulfitobl28_13910 [Sulfitobacter pontiacus]